MMFKDYIQDPNIFQIINPVSVGIKKWKVLSEIKQNEATETCEGSK